ncbi:EamA family transporter [Streptacidiphilus jiangxiensis]|uniref:Threonine/homoserine efflux transporter RhtA n=1 Tax=Streptacidiphilus jiangxiensis TaxID=235985 RepID=A0A1H7F0V2_STRJI|nr:EamA family transporter [Streptacidiphilus jiangxiensis]SEK19474.1 Threonine/homoserine efflux transporter RhtA [Streptacidiphilus jiangxiensis]
MHTRTSRSSLGLTLALVSAFSFGGSGVAAKPLIEAGLTPLQVVWVRMAGAALVLLPVTVRHRALLRRHPWLLLGFGLLGVSLVQVSYFFAISRIPVAIAMLLEYLGPSLLLGYVRFVQRRPVTRAAALGALTATLGLALVVEVWTGLGGLDPLGVLCGLGAAVSQVGYFVISEKAGRAAGSADPEARIDPVALSGFGLLIGAVLVAPLAQPWSLPWHVLGGEATMGSHRVPAFVLALWMVLVSTVVAYLAGVASVSRLSAPVASVVAFLEAVVATVLSWFLLGEHLATPQLLGGALVLVGAFVAQTSRPVQGSAEVAVNGEIAQVSETASR